MKRRGLPVLFDDRSAGFAECRDVIQGVRLACARSGVKLRPIPQKEWEQMTPDDLPEAVIITGTDMAFIRDCVSRLAASGRRAILAGLDAEQSGMDVSCAAPSRRAETQQLINYLMACGRQHFALVGFGVHSVNDTFRYHAAMSALAALGVPITPADTWQWQEDPAASFRAFIPHARQYDTVICPNDVIAICLINCLKEANLRVPEDLYVAAFGNKHVGRLYTPSITTMTMDMVHVGEQAFTVWQFIQNDPSARAVFKITVPNRILVRASTAWQTPPALSFQTPPAGDDPYYTNPLTAPLETIEKCLSQRDALDLEILNGLMEGASYEALCEKLFLSSSSLRYRLGKIFTALEVKTRHELESLLRSQLGSSNPFAPME